VRHGHVSINGKPVDIPSAQVKVGDVVSVREKSREIGQIKEAFEAVARRTVPGLVGA
jgi:small subunit ribosomal protein S4